MGELRHQSSRNLLRRQVIEQFLRHDVVQTTIGLQLPPLRPWLRRLEALLSRVNPITLTPTIPGDLPRDHRRIPTQPNRDRAARQLLANTPKDLVSIVDR